MKQEISKLTSRRQALLASGAVASKAATEAAQSLLQPSNCARPPMPGYGPNAQYFPQAVLTTHRNRRVLFYEDLLIGDRGASEAGGRAVLIHGFSARSADSRGLLENLAKVQDILGDAMGRSTFLYSLSLDPEHDTADVLADLASSLGVRDGWLLLTGRPGDLEQLRGALFRAATGAPLATHDDQQHTSRGEHRDCSVGLARYGNESIGVWGSCPTRSSPEWIAKRLRWVRPQRQAATIARRSDPSPSGTRPEGRRAGPHPHTYRS